MNEEYKLFVHYLQEYIEILTNEKKEFFISLCDIEDELLEQMGLVPWGKYSVVVVDKKDYSEAVRLRNDIHVHKIILLSGEGIKHIDSLKDFNEYSMLCEDKGVVWSCIDKVFDIKLSSEIKNFLGTILEEGEISLWELLQFLDRGIIDGCIDSKALNENLPMLGIWKSKENNVLKKGKTKRLIRFSRYSVIENRLTKAMTSGKIKKSSWEKVVSNSLANGDIQKIIETIYFEDAEEWLKSTGRSIREKEEDAAALELWHGFSYEYKLKEHTEAPIAEIEAEWFRERTTDNLNLHWEHYIPFHEDVAVYERRMNDLLVKIRAMMLPDNKKDILIEKVERLRESFVSVWEDIKQATPMCLNLFCSKAEQYTKNYLELLSLLIMDSRVRLGISGLGLAEDIQMLFCEKEADRILMPYYHPICAFYYMDIRKMYEAALKESLEETSKEESSKKDSEKGLSTLKDDVRTALIRKIGLQFPANMMSLHEMQDSRYALDHTTVWQSRAAEFIDIEEGIVYSVLDFKIIQKQVLDYIVEHPLLTTITIALVDISSLEGLEQLASKVFKLAQGTLCNLNKVDFLILSAREEELKQELSKMWETFGMKEVVRFRFGRNNFWNEKGYMLERIINEADMTILADSSVMYHEPRREKISEDANFIINRLERFDLEEQLQSYFVYGHSDISVLWATLQQASESKDDGLWRWENREPDNRILSFCNQTVDMDEDKTIVALSSNKNILSQIFMTNNMNASCKKYNGKSITIISFDSCYKSKNLPINGTPQISYSLNQFFDEGLDIEEISKQLFPFVEDITLDFYYDRNQLWCKCNLVEEDGIELDDGWKDTCINFLSWKIEKVLAEDNIFAVYFCELLISQWQERAFSIPAALMVERLGRDCEISIRFTRNEKTKDEEHFDSLEAQKIYEMIRFVDGKAIDEWTINQFAEKYRTDMLAKVLQADNEYHLIEVQNREKLQKMQERIKGE